MLVQIIVRICDLDWVYLSLTHSFGRTPKLTKTKFSPKKPEISLYRTYKRHFDILNRLGLDHECDRRTGRRTESPLAIARSTYASSKLHFTTSNGKQ